MLSYAAAITVTMANPPSDAQALAEQVATTFVHRLFPSLRSPAFLACPDVPCSEMCRAAITAAAKRGSA